jgi:hypothetical protein
MRHIIFRLLALLVLIAAVTGIAVLAYNAGGAHQAAISAQSQGTQNPVTTYPIYPFWWPFPFLGFGFFGLLAAFFLFWVAFAALRFMFWGPRFGWHRGWRGYSHWGERGQSGDIPTMFTDLHRRMHESERGKPADQATQNEA